MMNAPVFLSAGEPLCTIQPGLEEVLQERLATQRNAIRAMCACVLPHRPLVVASSPFNTSFVRGIAARLSHNAELRKRDFRPQLITFQSRFLAKRDDGSIMIGASDLKGAEVDPESGVRNMSLLRLRYAMIGKPTLTFDHPFASEELGRIRLKETKTYEFAAGVFIGDGANVEREFEIFRSFHPHTPVYPVATTGLTSAKLLSQLEGVSPGLRDALSKQTAYGVLFQALFSQDIAFVPAPPRRSARERYGWREHLDPESLDRGYDAEDAEARPEAGTEGPSP